MENFWVDLWKLFWPFLSAFLITFAIIAVPVGIATDNDHINFWLYILVQQGIWAIASIFLQEMIMHSALPGKSTFERRLIMLGGGIVYLLFSMTICAAGLANFGSFRVIGVISPVVVSVLAYYPFESMVKIDSANRTDMNIPLVPQHTSFSDFIVPPDLARAAGCSVVDMHANADTDTERKMDDASAVAGGTNSSNSGSSNSSNSVECTSLERTTETSPTVTRSKIIQHRAAVAYLIGWCVTYYILESLTVFFSTANTSFGRFRAYVVFLVTNIILKEFMLRLGEFIDRGKVTTSSMFFMAEIMLAGFYYAFYRFLFESISTIQLFVALQVLHVFMEWCIYGLRTTVWWQKQLLHMNGFVRVLFTSQSSSMSLEATAVWARCRSVLYGTRLLITIYSALSFYIEKLFVTYGYNRYYFTKMADVTDQELLLLGIFLACSVVIEVVNGVVLQRVIFQPNALNVWRGTVGLLEHNEDFSIYVTLMSSVLMCNIFVPFVNNKFSSPKLNIKISFYISIISAVALTVWIIGYIKFWKQIYSNPPSTMNSNTKHHKKWQVNSQSHRNQSVEGITMRTSHHLSQQSATALLGDKNIIHSFSSSDTGTKKNAEVESQSLNDTVKSAADSSCEINDTSVAGMIESQNVGLEVECNPMQNHCQ